MREVKWHPNERVDIPDMTAVTRSSVGEFRRSIRTLLVGDRLCVVRGFQVEPEAPATSRVVVKLDNAGVLSSAVGAENVPVSGLDTGVLIGDHDISFFLEGAAQLFVDFTGQPIGTYIVEARLLISDGANDNRRFINPATLVEFSDNVPTRRVCGWQVRAVAVATGNEWLSLGSVAWDGTPVIAGDITDIRDLILEGKSPWTSTSQTSSAAGVPDFSRSVSRGSFGVSKAIDGIRALMRQIRDLKGPRDNGTWDWFSYLHQPPGRAWPAGQTRHLRSMDTVTFRIGDGVEDYADFNGVTGLQDCLTYIQTNLATLPRSIKVLINTRAASGEVTSVQTISAPFTLTNKSISIEGVDEGGGTARARVDVTLASGQVWLTAPGIRLVNVYAQLTVGSHDNSGLVSCSGGSGSSLGLELVNTWLLGKTAPAGSVYALVAGSRSHIDRCTLQGRILFNGVQSYVKQSSISGQVIVSGAGTVFEACGLFTKATATAWTTPSTYLAMCEVTTTDVVFRSCAFHGYSDDENLLVAHSFAARMLVDTCRFTNQVGTHAPYALDAARGTGWGVMIRQDTGVRTDHAIRNSFFELYSTDAGSIYVNNAGSTKIDSCTFQNGSRSAAVGNTAVDVLIEALTNGAERVASVTNCLFGTHPVKRGGISILGQGGVIVQHNCFQGGDLASRTIRDAAILLARDLSGASFSVWNTSILNNTFVKWRGVGASPGDGRVIHADAIFTSFINCYGMKVHGNTFYACENGYSVDLASGHAVVRKSSFANNVWNAQNDGKGICANGATCDQNSFSDNVCEDNPGGPGATFLLYYVTGSGFIHGNVFPTYNITRQAGTAVARGDYQGDAFVGTIKDANYVNAYT